MPAVRARDGGIAPKLDGKIAANWLDLVGSALGKEHRDIARYVADSIGLAKKEPKHAAALFNSVMAALSEMKPRDHLERLLLAEAFIAHDRAMAELREADLSGLSDARSAHLDNALKLMRLFSGHIDVLRRYRKSGVQNISLTCIGATQLTLL